MENLDSKPFVSFLGVIAFAGSVFGIMSFFQDNASITQDQQWREDDRAAEAVAESNLNHRHNDVVDGLNGVRDKVETLTLPTTPPPLIL